MPRPKDSKVWNEDLILALQAREQMARQNGKRSHIAWKEGRQHIESVRGDIYTFKNGRIVNLPTKLKTTVDNVCRCIIAGTEPIRPAGYVPHNMRPQNGENPYTNDPYLKSIKKRGGAFAILMAFHTAAYDDQVLTKDDICRLAQPYCDTEMDANYMAGRARGAWSSIKTLEAHDLIMVQKRRTHYDGNAGGFRSLGCNSYMLTANGKLFIQALFQLNPDLKQHIGTAADATLGGRAVSSNNYDAFADIGFLDVPNGNLEESWQDDYTPFASTSSSALPLKTSPSRPFAAIFDNGHVLDASPSAKPQLQFIPACEAARLAALERHAIQESKHMAKHGNATGKSISVKNRTSTKTTSMTPTKNGIANANKITPSSCTMLSSISNHEQQRLKPPPVIALYSDDSDDDETGMDNRKIPVNPYYRTSVLSIQDQEQKSTGVTSQLPLVLEIDSDSDDDILLQNPLSSKIKHTQKRQNVVAVDLSKTLAARKCDENDSDDDYIQIESQSSYIHVVEANAAAFRGEIDHSTLVATSQQLTIYIDDRERNRNSTPRTLRMELTRLVSSDSKGSLLSIVWPKTIPCPIVEERRLANGDFSFHRATYLPPSLTSSEPAPSIHIPILVERKRIGDIVQRSTKKDHWYQLQRMQDEAICVNDHQNTSNGICVILLEGDPRTTRQYESYGAQNVDTTSPHVHTIDDEETLYRYMCRAILNGKHFHKIDEFQAALLRITDSTNRFHFPYITLDQDHTTRFVQTSDEQGSLRMVGVLGLMAITNERLRRGNQNVPKINTKAERVCIIKRLQNCGIPWTLVARITDEIRSVQQMDKLYSSIDDISCRELMLVPLISDLCGTEELPSVASAWSKAIYSAWISKLPDPTTVMKQFNDLSPIVDDQALLLEKLHNGLCAELALDEVLGAAQKKQEKQLNRIVCIDLPKDFADCFPSSSTNSPSVFRLNTVDRPQKIPSIVMRTYAGPFYSPRCIMFTIDGDDIVRRIQSTLKHYTNGQSTDYVNISKTLAEKTHRDFCVVVAKDDTIVMLIRALGLALDNAAKKSDYKPEVRVLGTLVLQIVMTNSIYSVS